MGRSFVLKQPMPWKGIFTMKEKLKDDLLETVIGGISLDTLSPEEMASGKILLNKLTGLGGTAICPVCGKRYDPAAPHVCSADLKG